MSRLQKKPKLLLPSMSPLPGRGNVAGRTSRFSREQIEAALTKHNGNQRAAAAELGTSHQNLGPLLRSMNIDPSLYQTVSQTIIQSRQKTPPTKDEIEAALAQNNGNQSLAAKSLGVSQGFLSKQIKKTGVKASFYMGPKREKERVGATGYYLLSTFVSNLWGDAETMVQTPVVTPVAANIPQNATYLALKKYGERILSQAPALANVAGLTLKMLLDYARLRVSQIRPAAARLARETEIRSLPTEVPKAIRRAWLWEVRNPETEVLFGDTVSIAGYWYDDRCHIIGQQHPDGIRVVSWRPQWGASDAEAGTDQPLSDRDMGFLDKGSFEEHQQWSKEAVRFCLSMAILLEAHETPLSVRHEDGKKNSGRAKGQPLKESEWSVDHVYLTVEPKPRPLTKENTPPRPNANAVSELVIVKGYLKRQRFGERNSQTRWVWVAPYEAIRWRSDKPKRTIIH